MTDGIIQQVIDNLISEQEKHGLNKPVQVMDICNTLLQTKHELIERIKLAILSMYEQNPCIPASHLRLFQIQLIGDNK